MDGDPNGLDDALAGELRAALDAVLAGGMADDAVAHAGQVAAIMTVFDRAFRAGIRAARVRAEGSALGARRVVRGSARDVP